MKEYDIDVTDMPIGRAASLGAAYLMGKSEVDFAPNKVADIRVNIRNISKIKVDPKKALQSKYYTHSGYIGNLKSKTLKEKIAYSLDQVFTEMVEGMLPNNKIRAKRLKRLRII